MRKVVIYLIILIIGGGIGYLLNGYFESSNKQGIENSQEDKDKNQSTLGKDTAFNKKNPKKNNSTSTEELVSNEENTEETLNPTEEEVEETSEETLLVDDGMEEDANKGNEEEEEIIIIKEELLSQRVLNIEPLKTDTSDASEVLELKSDSFAKKVTVEFWKSPLNITGYELTRNKLKLFGFNPSETIGLQLSTTGEQLLLNTETMSIILHKTKNFQSLTFK